LILPTGSSQTGFQRCVDGLPVAIGEAFGEVSLVFPVQATAFSYRHQN
jgi:hypothetical protein